LKALLHIMAYGDFDGKTANDPEIRNMFTRESLFESDWYRRRLETQQIVDRRRCERNLAYLKSIDTEFEPDDLAALDIARRIQIVEAELSQINADDFLKSLEGTLGADPVVATTFRPEIDAQFATSQ
jgi:hypothetical protein